MKKLNKEVIFQWSVALTGGLIFGALLVALVLASEIDLKRCLNEGHSRIYCESQLGI